MTSGCVWDMGRGSGYSKKQHIVWAKMVDDTLAQSANSPESARNNLEKAEEQLEGWVLDSAEEKV